jgi:hypothetical protein
MGDRLAMQLRSVDETTRTVTGVVVPYDETSYLTGDPAGERILRSAFKRSIHNRRDKIPLCLGHDHGRAAVGLSTDWVDDDAGLTGMFRIKPGGDGDQVLEDVRGGYLAAMSVGFVPQERGRGTDGAVEVRVAKLLEVSLVAVGAYDGARVLAVRAATQIDELLKPFRNPPPVDLSPFAVPWR